MTTKEAFTKALTRLLDAVGGGVPGDTQDARDRRLYTTAAIVGAIVLSRATPDETLADKLLRAVQRHVHRGAPRASKKARRTRTPRKGRV